MISSTRLFITLFFPLMCRWALFQSCLEISQKIMIFVCQITCLSLLGAVLFFSITCLFELVCLLLYTFVFAKLPIVKYYRTKAAAEGSKTVASDLAAAGIIAEQHGQVCVPPVIDTKQLCVSLQLYHSRSECSWCSVGDSCRSRRIHRNTSVWPLKSCSCRTSTTRSISTWYTSWRCQSSQDFCLKTLENTT